MIKGLVLSFFNFNPYEILVIQNDQGDLITIKIGIYDDE